MKKAHCPICGTAPTPAHTPFCSRGCKDRDLLNWLGEGYRMPGRAVATEALDSPEDRD